MGLDDWGKYRSAFADIHAVRIDGENGRKSLVLRGTKGYMYFLPKKDSTTMTRGIISGCFRVIYEIKEFSSLSEMRIYCMMSKEDIRENGNCYSIALHEGRRISLYKNFNGLDHNHQILTSLKLPSAYKRGILSLVWSYVPEIRTGVFLRGFLSVDPRDPKKTYRLFDYIDEDNPFTVSEGEGFGMLIGNDDDDGIDNKINSIIIEGVSLHSLKYNDPEEDKEKED